MHDVCVWKVSWLLVFYYFGTFSSLRGRKFEVHFKGQHVLHYPWEQYTGPRDEQEIEVKMLCHATHYSNASKIIRENDEQYQFQFLAFLKGSRNGRMKTYSCESYEDSTEDYTLEPVYDTVLPGFYSWWSPIAYNKTSLFGNIEFVANPDDLIQCYKKAFDPPLQEVQFCCGGTLRYEKQACKVIIISSKGENNLPNDKYPIIEMKEAFKLKYENPSGFYDTFAFAFYFPNPGMHLECPETIIECGRVKHRSCAKGFCPDFCQKIPEHLELTLEKLSKRKEAKEILPTLDERAKAEESCQASYNMPQPQNTDNEPRQIKQSLEDDEKPKIKRKRTNEESNQLYEQDEDEDMMRKTKSQKLNEDN